MLGFTAEQKIESEFARTWTIDWIWFDQLMYEEQNTHPLLILLE